MGYQQSDREELSVLRTRMQGLERDVQELAHTLQTQMASVTAAISALGTKLEERGRPQYMMMIAIAGLMMTVAGAIGALTISPLTAAVAEMRADIKHIDRQTLSPEEMRFRSDRAQEDRMRTQGELNYIRSNMVQRAEYEERWRAHDKQLDYLTRQVDEIKRR